MTLADVAEREAHHRRNGQQSIDLSPALVSFTAMLTLTLPERTRYLPWLPERGLAMVYGPRGVGKTQFTLGLATHLATGQAFLGWEVSQAVGVLYIDGEMPLDELRQRAVLLAEKTSPTSLFFLPGEMVYTRLGHDLVLTAEIMRHAVGAILEAHPEIRVVILDNISCLFSGISEDRKEDWEPVAAWLIRLRHRGLSVVLVHHAGKMGQQRGTSGREDALDTVIALDWPPNYDPQEGCHFHLRFTKARSGKGEEVTALDVRLLDTEDTGLTWQVAPLEKSRLEQVQRLLADGVTRVTDLAEELGITKGYASKLKRQAESTGGAA
jgi:putative DNA primase/helicase